jgi:hypothetical protein
MQSDDEERRLRSAALQNVQSILHARQRAEHELLEIKEALEEETRILEILNQTGATLASKLDLEGVVQAVTDAGTRLSGAQVGAFSYATPSAEAAAFRGRVVIRIADAHEDPRYADLGEHNGVPTADLPVRSYLAVPVIGRSGEGSSSVMRTPASSLTAPSA